MGYKYNPHRSRNLYDPASDRPFRISRSKIDRFVECPRCFYIDRRLGTDRPPGFPFNINSAVDTLLKTEFDTHRAAGTPHPLQQAYDIDAIPAAHAEIDAWRENFKGVRYHHAPTNLVVTGAIDDLWVDKAGEYYVVDLDTTNGTSVNHERVKVRKLTPGDVIRVGVLEFEFKMKVRRVS